MTVKINTSLSTNMFDENFELTGEFDKKKKILSYKEKEFQVVIDLSKRKMTRQNDEYSITFNMDMCEGNYLSINLFESKLKASVPVKYEFISVGDNFIETKYITVDNDEKVNYRVSWEEV